jgi:hypothetical protein
MKFQSPNSKTFASAGALVGGGVVGAMVGRGITSVIAKPASDTPTESEKTKKLVVHVVMAIAGVAGAASIEGKDVATDAAKGALIGITIDNTISAVSHLANNSETLKTKLATDSKVNTFAKGALGLGCPSCGTDARTTFMRSIPTLQRPRRRSLNAPYADAIPALVVETAIPQVA